MRVRRSCKRRVGEGGFKERKKGKGKIVEDMLMEIDKRLEMRERKESRRNIIRVKVKRSERKEAEKVLKVIRVKTDMEEIRKLRKEKKCGKMLLVKLKDEEQKREIMKTKRKLKDRREKVIKDWTWKERKMR